jgi:hypothetical protein
MQQFERSHPVLYCGKPFTPTGSESYTGTEALALLHEEAGNRLTGKVTRQDATDPKQKAVTDYKEQVDRHPLPPPPSSTGKLRSRRTNTTTTDIIARIPISEQRSQEIAR